MEQPNDELRRLLDNVLMASPTTVEFCGKRKTIGWLHKGTIRKFSHIGVTENDEWKKDVKTCATVLLNNKWKIMLFYWIYWRWLYYVKDVSIVEVLRVLDVCKKKVPSVPFSLATILVTGMTDLMMTMTKVEAEPIQAGQAGAQPSR